MIESEQKCIKYCTVLPILLRKFRFYLSVVLVPDVWTKFMNLTALPNHWSNPHHTAKYPQIKTFTLRSYLTNWKFSPKGKYSWKRFHILFHFSGALHKPVKIWRVLWNKRCIVQKFNKVYKRWHPSNSAPTFQINKQKEKLAGSARINTNYKSTMVRYAFQNMQMPKKPAKKVSQQIS